MSDLKSYSIIALVFLAIGALLGYFVPRAYEEKPRSLASIDAMVAHHEVKTAKPVQALDKKQLAGRGAITKAVAKDQTAEVLATGEVKDASGTRRIAAVLDTDAGTTELVEKRSFAEKLDANELGAGITAGTLGVGWQAEYRHTFARVWNFYPDFRMTLTDWLAGPRYDHGEKLDGMATLMLTYRW